MSPHIKICCIQDTNEAKLAISSGASALGLVARMPSGPGPISDERIKEIAASIPPPIATFLLTSETTVDAIIAHHKRTHTNTIQIVDALTHGTHRQLKAALPSVKIVQVIHVLDERSVEEAIEISSEVDALLLDSGNPTLAVKVLGGTGQVHNWTLSRRIRNNARCPLFLAGGLTPENVRHAIDTVQPFGLDLCSSIRTDGKLDERKLQRFVEEALRA